jgi:hypothetical protein
MKTKIIFHSVNKRYARIVPDRVGTTYTTYWEQHPADATTYNDDEIQPLFRDWCARIGPALDGAVEIRDQIEETNRIKDGRYRDSEEYEDGDDTDAA